MVQRCLRQRLRRVNVRVIIPRGLYPSDAGTGTGPFCLRHADIAT